MTHHPEAEEFLQHLIGPDHACSEAISLRQAIIGVVTSRRASSTLVPAQGQLQVDVTSEVAAEIADRIDEFYEIHMGHHLSSNPNDWRLSDGG